MLKAFQKGAPTAIRKRQNDGTKGAMYSSIDYIDNYEDGDKFLEIEVNDAQVGPAPVVLPPLCEREDAGRDRQRQAGGKHQGDLLGEQEQDALHHGCHQGSSEVTYLVI